MNAIDLMLGDWVYNSSKEKCKVYAISNMFDSNIHLDNYDKPNDGCFELVFEVEPIPLTPEILEKNGFRKIKWESNSYVNDESEAAYMCFSIGDYTNLWGGGDQDYVWITVKYVHQLQHALRLCRIEKEIVL